jgi:hypothetical protein
MLTIQHYKESLSRAYITAVVGQARQQLKWGSEYDYGVDGQVKKIVQKSWGLRESGFGFDFQAKSSTNWELREGHLIYDLEVDNYNDLVERSEDERAMPLLLILMCLDPSENNWLEVDSESLLLRKCSYWFQVDSSFSDNVSTKRIAIPAKNIFTSTSIVSLLDQIENGELLP